MDGRGLEMGLVRGLVSPATKSIVPCCCREGRAGTAPSKGSHCLCVAAGGAGWTRVICG